MKILLLGNGGQASGELHRSLSDTVRALRGDAIDDGENQKRASGCKHRIFRMLTEAHQE